MQNDRYFARTWALLTRDKGWVKPLLVMAAASLVPIVGEFGNSGFALEWGRLSAWGADAAPKQKNVDIGKCIASGFRAFVVSLGYGIALNIVFGMMSGVAMFLPEGLAEVVSLAVSALSFVASVFWGVVVCIAELRCAIYESIGAGYRPDRVFELIKRDTSGFLRLCVVNLVGSFVIGLITGVFVVLIIFMFIPFFMQLGSGHVDDYRMAMSIAGALVWMLPLCAIFGYLISFFTNALRMILVNCVGLWMRQFNVPAWGRSEDPLPNYTSGYNQQAYQYDAPQPQAQQYARPEQPQQQPYVQQAPREQREPYVQPFPTEQSAQVETIPLVPVQGPGQDTAPQDGQPMEDPRGFGPIPEPNLEGADHNEIRVIPTREDVDADALYDEFMQTLRENDHVPEDDDE